MIFISLDSHAKWVSQTRDGVLCIRNPFIFLHANFNSLPEMQFIYGITHLLNVYILTYFAVSHH